MQGGLGLFASYAAQMQAVMPVFREGGAMSFNLASAAKKMGEPLKIASFKGRAWQILLTTLQAANYLKRGIIQVLMAWRAKGLVDYGRQSPRRRVLSYSRGEGSNAFDDEASDICRALLEAFARSAGPPLMARSAVVLAGGVLRTMGGR
jgi:hypothetical protein